MACCVEFSHRGSSGWLLDLDTGNDGIRRNPDFPFSGERAGICNIYCSAAMALPYVCLARRTAFPKPDLDIQFGDPDRPACDADKVQAKKTGPAVFSSVIYDMY